MKYYQTEKICAKSIGVKIDENGIIREIEFCGGCDGNTQGLEKLLLGMNKDDVIERLSGVDCRGKGTSCPDQLAKILEKVND